MKLSDIRKIAVLRSNGIGDYVFTLPALQSLRQAYPRAEIVVLGKPWHKEFLEGRPGPVDRVETIPPVKGVCDAPGTEDPRTTGSFQGRMRDERFDLLCQLYGGGRYSNPFCRAIGARFTVGMKAEDASAEGLNAWIPYIYYYPEVLRYLEVVKLAGAKEVTRIPRLQTAPRDIGEAHPLLPHPAPPLVVLNPGASDSRRQWPTDRFASVGKALAAEGYTVSVSGSEADRAICSEVKAGIGGGCLDLCGKLSLNGLAGLLSLAALVVSNDSGPLHLARALGTPTVCLYWVGNLINAGAPNIRFHRWHISWRLNCPVCGTNCIDSSCSHRPSFIAGIPVEPVIKSCMELLNAR
jgi:ADP-heptose:LPS heptosyltransferase